MNVSYVYGLGLIRQDRGGLLSYYQVDGLGSVRVLTDSTGNVTDRYTYDAFGRTIARAGNTVNPYQFAGQPRCRSRTGLPAGSVLRPQYRSVH